MHQQRQPVCIVVGTIGLLVALVLFLTVLAFGCTLGIGGVFGMLSLLAVGIVCAFAALLPHRLLRKTCKKHSSLMTKAMGGSQALLAIALLGTVLLLTIWSANTNLLDARLRWFHWVQGAKVAEVAGTSDYRSVFVWGEGKIVPGAFGQKGSECAFPLVPDGVRLPPASEGTRPLADYPLQAFLICSVDGECLEAINKKPAGGCLGLIRRLWDGQVRLDQLVSVKRLKEAAWGDTDGQGAIRQLNRIPDAVVYDDRTDKWVVNATARDKVMRISASPTALNIYTPDDFDMVRAQATGDFLAGILALVGFVSVSVAFFSGIMLTIWLYERNGDRQQPYEWEGDKPDDEEGDTNNVPLIARHPPVSYVAVHSTP